MWYEWLGYVASLIVLVSLVMSSVKRLRWINLVGSLVFAAYGIIIKSYPVAVMNLGIVLVNTYYLYQIYHQKDALKVIQIQNVAYLETFVNHYKADMKKFMALDVESIYKEDHIKFFVTRNTVPAGLFVGKKNNNETLEVLIDYTTPTYRDFKIGKFIYEDNKDRFKDLGIKKLISHKGNEKHQSYLARMGFKLNEQNDLMEKVVSDD